MNYRIKYIVFRKGLFFKLFLLLLFYGIALHAEAQIYQQPDSTILAQRRRASNTSRVNARPLTPFNGSIHINRNTTIAGTSRDNGYTPEQLVREIFIKSGGETCATEGTVSNVKFTGLGWSDSGWIALDRALSHFSNGGTTGLGMEEGLLLSTGGGRLAEGPNQDANGNALSDGMNITSDSDLQSLVEGINLTSGAILEFDFVPHQSEISFEYIFASEEYSGFVNSEFNDVFGFFISGPGITGKKNIALLPTSTTGDYVVSINNVNNGRALTNTAGSYPGSGKISNPEYFVPNYQGNPYMEYGGRTVILTARQTVIPGQTYHLKLAVANAGGDSQFGSGVFLKAGSFDLGLGITNHGGNISGMDNIFQACEDNWFTLGINPRSTPTTIGLTYSGTGANDICQPDGSLMPASIIVPANQTEISVPYKVKPDVTTNGGEITIRASLPDCGDPITKTLYVYTNFMSAAIESTDVCSSEDGTIKVTATGGSPRIQMSKDGGANWQNINTPFTDLAAGTYSVMVRDSVACNTETLSAIILDRPALDQPTGGTYCSGDNIEISAFTGTSGTVFNWTCSNTAIGLAAAGTGNIPVFTAVNSTSAPIEATIRITPVRGNCTGDDKEFKIIINPVPVINPVSDIVICNSTTLTVPEFVSATDGTTFTWVNDNPAIGLAAGGTGSIAPFLTANSTNAPIVANITVTPGYGNCEGISKTFTITVNPTPKVQHPNNYISCNGREMSGITFQTPTIPSEMVTYSWTNDRPDIGIAATGTSPTIPPFVLTNNSDSPVTANIRVTPMYDNSCTGTPMNFWITVNPTARLNPIADQIVCNGQAMPAITFSTPATPSEMVTYSWTNDQPGIGIAATGTTSEIPAFTATNNVNTPVTANITVTPKYGECTRATVAPFTFKITVHPQVVTGSITGNPFVCPGAVPSPMKGDPGTGGSGIANFEYQWQSSSDEVVWADISDATGQDYTPLNPLLADTYFRRITTDNFCNTEKHYSNIFLIKVVSEPVTLYWKADAVDNDWNNPANWVDKNGVQSGMVPLACSDVVITSGADIYPSLNTASAIYGDPVCENITFQPGAELLYQHKLQYKKAYVQYDFGYYGDTESTTAKKRDIWYALAAPLKKMASGDFSLAGYPLTWQGNFQTSEPEPGKLQVGDFSKTFSRNDIDLSSTNGAIALKVAGYSTQTGFNDHRNLDSLRGVIQIPYFENPTTAKHFTAHTYDSITKQSTFYYFDNRNLKIIYNPIGRMARADEAYRFIYETENGKTETINGVPGYRQKIVKPDDNSQRVMVGNPLMASLNPEAFFAMNSDVLDEQAGFELLSEDQNWTQYEYDIKYRIPSGQAFVITLKDGLENVTLNYQFENNDLFSPVTKLSSGMHQNTSVYLSISQARQDTEKRDAILKANQTIFQNEKNIPKMIFPEGSSVMEAFFVTPDGKEFNLIQYLDKNDHEIGIGIKGSDVENVYTLNFENISIFAIENNTQAVLYDKLLNIEQDLLQNPRYSFRQSQTGLNTQSSDVNRFKLRLKSVSAKDMANDIRILYHGGRLEITSTSNIDNVKLYNLQGQQIHGYENIGATYYSKILSLNNGAYIIRVHTENGNIKTAKIME